jgi:hypothetical protein
MCFFALNLQILSLQIGPYRKEHRMTLINEFTCPLLTEYQQWDGLVFVFSDEVFLRNDKLSFSPQYI